MNLLYHDDLFRFTIIKYADRGLVNDHFYYNNINLFKYLFWIANSIIFMLNQGYMWSYYVKNGKSFFSDVPKNILCTSLHSMSEIQLTLRKKDCHLTSWKA